MARKTSKVSDWVASGAIQPSAVMGTSAKPRAALKVSGLITSPKEPGHDAKLLPHRGAARLYELANDLARTTMPHPKSMEVCVHQICRLYDGAKRNVKLREWDLPKEGEQVIYRLSVLDHATLRRFDEERDRIPVELKKEIALARFKKLSPDSTTLYVGASQDLPVRLEWHFGIKRPHNFALHLSHWIPADMRDTPITLEYWPIAGLGLTHDLAAQALEDAMWTECAPLFGRQGAK